MRKSATISGLVFGYLSGSLNGVHFSLFPPDLRAPGQLGESEAATHLMAAIAQVSITGLMTPDVGDTVNTLDVTRV